MQRCGFAPLGGVAVAGHAFLVAGVASILFLVKMSKLGSPDAEGSLARRLCVSTRHC